jgi:hypothetical protein
MMIVTAAIKGYARIPGKTGLAMWEIGEVRGEESVLEYLLHQVKLEAEQVSSPKEFKGPALLLIENVKVQVDQVEPGPERA